jgi:hypothetical protein
MKTVTRQQMCSALRRPLQQKGSITIKGKPVEACLMTHLNLEANLLALCFAADYDNDPECITQ